MNLNWQKDFYHELTDPSQLTALFDCMPDVYFYAKNLKSQFMMASQSQLKLLGVQTFEECCGKTDHDFYEKNYADMYVGEDSKVFNGEPIINYQWMVPDQDGQMNWYLSTKLPIKNHQGNIFGLCGLLRDLRKSGQEFKPYYDLSQVIDYVNQNFRQAIKVQTLADIIGLSVSQLDRKFKNYTGVTPSTYIIKVRLAAAARDLLQTDKTVSQLAYEYGFYDHSQLSRFFKKHYHVSPTEYRQRNKSD